MQSTKSYHLLVKLNDINEALEQTMMMIYVKRNPSNLLNEQDDDVVEKCNVYFNYSK